MLSSEMPLHDPWNVAINVDETRSHTIPFTRRKPRAKTARRPCGALDQQAPHAATTSHPPPNRANRKTSSTRQSTPTPRPDRPAKHSRWYGAPDGCPPLRSTPQPRRRSFRYCLHGSRQQRGKAVDPRMMHRLDQHRPRRTAGKWLDQRCGQGIHEVIVQPRVKDQPAYVTEVTASSKNYGDAQHATCYILIIL